MMTEAFSMENIQSSFTEEDKVLQSFKSFHIPSKNARLIPFLLGLWPRWPWKVECDHQENEKDQQHLQAGHLFRKDQRSYGSSHQRAKNAAWAAVHSHLAYHGSSEDHPRYQEEVIFYSITSCKNTRLIYLHRSEAEYRFAMECLLTVIVIMDQVRCVHLCG